MRRYQALVLVFVLVGGCNSDGNDECGPGQIRDSDRCIPDDGISGLDPVVGCMDSDATEDDESCVYEVTFEVDLSAEGLGNDDVVYLRGTFNEFAATANPMSDADGDDVWELVLNLAPGMYEYLYTIGDIGNGGVDETVPTECDFNPDDESANRGFMVTDAPAVPSVHRFSACPGQVVEPGDFETITFDDPAITYTLTGFGGAENATLVADPGDATKQVAQVVRSAAAETFAGTTVSLLANEAIPPLPLDAANTRMTVRVQSPAAGITVRLKVEDSTDNTISVETETMTTTANAFEILTFDFANEASGTAALDVANTYDKITIFFNFGTPGSTAGEQTYLFDDIAFIGGGGTGGGGGAFETITFDNGALTYTFTGFGGAENAMLVADPGNGAQQVAQVVRSATAETFAGTTVSLLANQAIPPLPFDAANTRMTVRVQSPAAGITVRLKVEDSTDNAVSVETETVTTTANAFEILTFDFANEASGTAALDVANTYDKISIFFNFGTPGSIAGEQTYLFDDIAFIGGGGTGGGGGAFETITFDNGALTYTFTGFGGAENAMLVADPGNGARQVAQVVRSATAETFAGTTVSTLANQAIPVIPFEADSTTMTVRVLSPVSGIQVRLKVEDSTDPTISVETEATTTTSGVFEVLTFDFSNEATGTAAINFASTYDKISIFFNFGALGADVGEQTFLFDDMTFVP